MKFVRKILLISLVAIFGINQPVLALIPDDPFFYKQGYHSQIFSQDAWDRVQGLDSVIVAIIDSGVDIDHPDLIDNIWRNHGEKPGDGIDNDRNGFIDDVNGWDFVENSPDPRPKTANESAVIEVNGGVVKSASKIGLNHGTVVAGVVAGKGNNKEGIAGVCWRCRIMPIRILDSSGDGDTINVVRAIDYALANGAQVINLSFVGFDQSALMDDAVRRAHNNNVVVIAASGNESKKNGVDLDLTPGYPICSGVEINKDWVIGVTAVDRNDKKAKFANYGRSCIDVAAPGVNLFSSQTQVADLGLFELYGDGWSGTSMAAPLVAGAAALLKSLRPSLGVKEISDIIINTTDLIEDLNPDFAGGKLGKGRINLFKAILAAAEYTGENRFLTNPSGSTVKIDFPDQKSAGTSLVVAPAGNSDSVIQIFDLDSGIKVRSYKVFLEKFAGGLNVATADIDNDGQEEIVVAPGEGGSPQMKIFNTSGKLIRQFEVGPKTAKGGASIALADVDSDKKLEIIVGAGKGQLPLVKVYTLKGKLKKAFLAFPQDNQFGVQVSAADLEGKGEVEILAATGKGAVGTVNVFSRNGKLKNTLIPFPNFKGGISLSAGDLNRDKFKEIVVSPRTEGGPIVQIYSHAGRLVGQFSAFDKTRKGGLNLAVGSISREEVNEIFVGSGKDNEPRVQVYDLNGTKKLDLLVYPMTYRLGVRTAVLNENFIK